MFGRFKFISVYTIKLLGIARGIKIIIYITEVAYSGLLFNYRHCLGLEKVLKVPSHLLDRVLKTFLSGSEQNQVQPPKNSYSCFFENLTAFFISTIL